MGGGGRGAPDRVIKRKPVAEASVNAGRASSAEQAPDYEDEEEVPPYHPGEEAPQYDVHAEALNIQHNDLESNAQVTDDGRINIKINATTSRISKLLASNLRSWDELDVDVPPEITPVADKAQRNAPRLNIVIQIVGSRGDVQPFVSLGLELQKCGHRVRIATHAVFQKLVEGVGLEFFCIGGDPAELMVFMIKNPGLLPKLGTLKSGEIQKRRKAVGDIMRGCWKSCFMTGNGMESPIGEPADEMETAAPFRQELKPFVADAIIANPPSFAHMHCAEKLGIPLHLMFTMPWSATQAFPHPLANVTSTDSDVKVTNYLTYVFVDLVTWQGLGDVINTFRHRVLKLDAVDPVWALASISKLKIPYTYCWSPALIPKPRDWGSHISIPGYYFLNLASNYTPAEDLLSFLYDGPPPIYIGFGSIVVDDPDALTATIFEAIKRSGVRALVSQGWGGLGNSMQPPPNVFMLGDCPHDWLFKRVSCVVHHGGAGTTAAGIAAGKPSIIVPFFGDQPFWGSMVHRAGAGPPPIPFKALTADGLACAIKVALQPEVVESATILGGKIDEERGSETGAQDFQHRLPVSTMACSLMPDNVAVWEVRKNSIRLSALAATVLRKNGLIKFNDLSIYRPDRYELVQGPWEPVSGMMVSVSELLYETFKGIGEIGSEFVRVPYVGQRRKKPTEDATKPTEDATQPTEDVTKPTEDATKPMEDATSIISQSSELSSTTALARSDEDRKFVGVRAATGIGRITRAAVRSPMTVTMALTQGANNVPKLWGDKTVRPQEKVTGIGSGLKAGVKSLALGTYDGVSGLVMQPVKGAQSDGVLGGVAGFGKGIVGLPFKFMTGAGGIVGYSLKGIDVEIRNAIGSEEDKAIKSARMIQGEMEYLTAREQEKVDIVERWHVVLAEGENSKRESKKKGKLKKKVEEEER